MRFLIVAGIMIAGLVFVGLGDEDPGPGPLPADVPCETGMLEERLLQTLRFGDKLEPAIRAIVRDEIARLARDPRFFKAMSN